MLRSFSKKRLFLTKIERIKMQTLIIILAIIAISVIVSIAFCKASAKADKMAEDIYEKEINK